MPLSPGSANGSTPSFNALYAVESNKIIGYYFKNQELQMASKDESTLSDIFAINTESLFWKKNEWISILGLKVVNFCP